MKYDRIETMRQDYPVTLHCRVFESRASGYYAWRKRPTSPRAKENARLEVEIAAAHKGTPGRRMARSGCSRICLITGCRSAFTGSSGSARS